MWNQSAAASLGYLWTWGCKFFILFLYFFSFYLRLSVLGFFLPSKYLVSRQNEKWECFRVRGGDFKFQSSSELPPLVIFGCCVLLFKKYSTCFQHHRWPLFFFFNSILKNSYIPLLFFGDENKWTCEVGHKNGIKCITKSLIILCIFL